MNISNLFINEVMVHRCTISQKIVDHFFINVFGNTIFPEQTINWTVLDMTRSVDVPGAGRIQFEIGLMLKYR